MKRARRDTTVLPQFLPLAFSSQAFAADSHPLRSEAPERPARWLPSLAVPGGWGVWVVMIVLAAAVGVTGYVALDEIENDLSASGLAPALQSAPVANRGAPAQPETPAPATSLPSVESNAPGDDASVRQAPLPPPAPARSANRKAVASGVITVLPLWPAPRVPAEHSEPDAQFGSPPTASPAPPAAAPPQEPLKLDRWQTMNAAIAGCPRADFFAGVLCEQRVRLQYCEGYWGHAPECRGANRSDNGR